MKRLSGAIPGDIARRVASLQSLDAALRDCLPPECAAHCRVAGLSGTTLHLVADSPAWRARIGFYSREIIQHISRLRKSPVERLNIRVGRPEAPGPQRSALGGAPPMPRQAARAFAALAAETTDPELRKVLERLSRHGRDT